jgi:hypothetical protein
MVIRVEVSRFATDVRWACLQNEHNDAAMKGVGNQRSNMHEKELKTNRSCR